MNLKYQTASILAIKKGEIPFYGESEFYIHFWFFFTTSAIVEKSMAYLCLMGGIIWPKITCTKYWMQFCTAIAHNVRGGVKKKNFRPKKYHFLFLLPFDAETFKTCKNRIKLINLCALPCLGLGLWLTLTVFFDLA